MPRDLLADRNTLAGMPQLKRESKEPSSPPPRQAVAPSYTSMALVKAKKTEQIHPFVQLLNADDLDDCDWLEHAAFDPIEAASREKVRLNLSIYPLHLFQCVFPHLPYYDWAAVRRQDIQSSTSPVSDRRRSSATSKIFPGLRNKPR